MYNIITMWKWNNKAQRHDIQFSLQSSCCFTSPMLLSLLHLNSNSLNTNNASAFHSLLVFLFVFFNSPAFRIVRAIPKNKKKYFFHFKHSYSTFIWNGNSKILLEFEQSDMNGIYGILGIYFFFNRQSCHMYIKISVIFHGLF